ncbi:glycoside hydrolase family 79 protein [Coniophora puteana RWD-64-598 SS2]|uniref:Glycoside hydrolase family 79 protein n=1 Tax=Coniophora puteana (strain RWD-64-598) TaxID=741705 RepID=A0A5M3MYD2_CONPW|nr:glycoside hydrolase family 79 protein [Coniophora puteana RWD-64-598 SS2]EIW84140.1 glycoside hydrolase family 79 protein [Coniophora puteana RWD-64-598 SS2]
MKLALYSALAAPAVYALNVSLPYTAPPTAALLSPALVSFSIEQDRWVDWAGTEAPNDFFNTVLENIQNITGQLPWIRIGADSEDHTDFSYNLEYEEDIFPNSTAVTPYPEATNITVGQGFYDIISHLPAGTHVHWGVNLRQANLTAAYLETLALVKAFQSSAVTEKNITLDLIEVGNESDLYYSNGGRNSSWSIFEYVPQWIEFASNVSSAAGLSSSSYTKLIGGAFAGSAHNNLSGFSPQAIYNLGILESEPGSLITTISQHQYSGSFCTGGGAVLQDLMTKEYIRGNISVFAPDINATFENGLEYILGETNSMSCHGAPDVSNTAGAALWALDYSLYASQVGIKRLHFHEGIGYKYNFIQPVTLNYSILDGSPITPLAPHVQPPYYAAIIAAEAIGPSGTTQAIELNVNATDTSGYAFFEGQQLSRAIFINTVAYLPGANRSNTHIDLVIPGGYLASSQMTIKRLNIGYANDTSGLTWGGQSYETPDGSVSGQETVETVNVSDGLDIQETEAVLVQFL